MFIRYILLFCILSIILFSINESGKSPSKKDLLKYNNLSYFYDGKFHNIYKSIYGFKKLERFGIVEKEYNNSNNFQNKNKLTIKPIFNDVPDYFSIYWLGHSNIIFELSNKRIIVDPVFGNGLPVPFLSFRWVKSPIKRDELPKIDYVLITHNHYDHLERKTIKFLKNKVSKFIVPLGVDVILKSWGVKSDKIVALGWGDKIKLNNIVVNAEPAIHFSGRFLLDGNKTLWNSYVLQILESEKIKKQIFCAGDSGYGEHIDYIAKKYKSSFDLMAIEIDAWNWKWPYIHMFPQEVIEVAKKLNTKYILPVHYGVFPLGMHKRYTSLNIVTELAKKEKIIEKLLIPEIGEKTTIK